MCFGRASYNGCLFDPFRKTVSCTQNRSAVQDGTSAESIHTGVDSHLPWNGCLSILAPNNPVSNGCFHPGWNFGTIFRLRIAVKWCAMSSDQEDSTQNNELKRAMTLTYSYENNLILLTFIQDDVVIAISVLWRLLSEHLNDNCA